MGTLSVVLPTLNCLDLLPAHLESMGAWLDLAAEVIVVDSHSEDGTVDYLRRHLRHPGLVFVEHPRGLYASWNFGIARAQSDWTYISTVGDSITRELLLHLREAGDALRADLVLSTPDFLDGDGNPVRTPPIWPSEQIAAALGLGAPAVIPAADVYFVALVNARHAALLGSAASNLFRTRALQERPFPVDPGLPGDAAWAFSHALGIATAVTPRRGSTFWLHPPPASAPVRSAEDTACGLWELAARRLAGAQPALLSEHRLPELTRLLIAHTQARLLWDQARSRHRRGWWLLPSNWTLRASAKRLQGSLDRLMAASNAVVLSRSGPDRPAVPAPFILRT